MRLAKNHIDVGIFSNREAEQLAFWQNEVGLEFEETLPLGGRSRQQRHGMNGSVFKLNTAADPLPAGGWTGYRELLIARPGLTEPRSLTDPDGNPVTLVPPGHDGITGIGLRMAVRDAAAFDHFFGTILQLPSAGERRYLCGDSLLMFDEDANAARAGDMRAMPGYRYITIQVWDCDTEHRGFLERGAEEGRPPITLGTTARISFIRDPDGNQIEISQRGSLTGSVAANPSS